MKISYPITSLSYGKDSNKIVIMSGKKEIVLILSRGLEPPESYTEYANRVIFGTKKVFIDKIEQQNIQSLSFDMENLTIETL